MIRHLGLCSRWSVTLLMGRMGLGDEVTHRCLGSSLSPAKSLCKCAASISITTNWSTGVCSELRRSVIFRIRRKDAPRETANPAVEWCVFYLLGIGRSNVSTRLGDRCRSSRAVIMNCLSLIVAFLFSDVENRKKHSLKA